MQCVAVCCSVLQCAWHYLSCLHIAHLHARSTCRALQCVAACCSMLQCVVSTHTHIYTHSMYLNLNSYSNLQSLHPISHSISNFNAENIRPGRCRSSTRRCQHCNLSRSLLHSCNGPPSCLPAWQYIHIHYKHTHYIYTQASAAECLALLGLLNM